MDEHREALLREAAEYERRIAVCESQGDKDGQAKYEARKALVESELGSTRRARGELSASRKLAPVTRR